MRTRLAAIVILAVVAWAGDVAWAFQCPALIQQARAALEQFKRAPGLAAVKDAKIAAVETNLRNAEAAHGGGQHDEAVRQATEALKLLGK